MRDLFGILSGSSTLSFILSSLFVGFFVVDMTYNAGDVAVVALPIVLVGCTMLLLRIFNYIYRKTVRHSVRASESINEQIWNLSMVDMNSMKTQVLSEADKSHVVEEDADNKDNYSITVVNPLADESK